MKFYAGIGSRRTPEEVLQRMRSLARQLAQLGYVLRSGAADGADAAFESGCAAAGGAMEIWLPWRGFNGHADTGLYPSKAHADLAKTVHPAWERLSRGPQALHSRNVGQVLGADCATPVEFVLCWTPEGCQAESERTRDTGGTGTAIVLADRRGIPVFNLARAGALGAFLEFVRATNRRFHPDGTVPEDGQVWVFGSNLAGRHGKGAALVARERFGATPGVGRGRMGNAYGIPTKTATLRVRSLADIAHDVADFIAYARHNKAERFFVTRVGCQLAGYADGQIARLFAEAPLNCSFPDPWRRWLGCAAQQAKATRVVHVKEQPFDVYIGRKNGELPESAWANPYHIGRDGTRDEVVQAYHRYILGRPDLMTRLGELRGRVLGCWCKTQKNPHVLCHGDVLASLADSGQWSSVPADEAQAVQRSLF